MVRGQKCLVCCPSNWIGHGPKAYYYVLGLVYFSTAAFSVVRSQPC